MTKYNDGKCDVHGDPSPGRLHTMQKYPDYVTEVQQRRKHAGKEQLDFSKAKPPMRRPTVTAHAIKKEEVRDEDSLQDVYARMEELWGQEEA